ncbi:hypothetical protein BCR42DRAFT_429469 [Absidia repens]|uniref:Uncharacterized protein n=1 Tax=Absidia repens TaxID=90262 RepID=A0A1X2HWW9_9FUNG|nr:hypothetical protein BCR42DRAFT_429469 [Absidia repens]
MTWWTAKNSPSSHLILTIYRTTLGTLVYTTTAAKLQHERREHIRPTQCTSNFIIL